MSTLEDLISDHLLCICQAGRHSSIQSLAYAW